MPVRNARVVPDPRPPQANWVENYGPPPYYRIELEFEPGLWDRIAFLGRHQLKQVLAGTGAILAKETHGA